MHPEILTSFAKPILALGVAGATVMADAMTSELPGVPSWLTSLGLPVAFLVIVIYALVAIHKALRESEKGRRDDWGNYATKLETMLTNGEKCRAELIDATKDQTREIKALADHMKSRPCQK